MHFAWLGRRRSNRYWRRGIVIKNPKATPKQKPAASTETMSTLATLPIRGRLRVCSKAIAPKSTQNRLGKMNFLLRILIFHAVYLSGATRVIKLPGVPGMLFCQLPTSG